MEITRPVLVINKTTCLRNIELMVEKARRNNVRFRPHFKTHQSIEIGRWFKDYGIKAIAVSSLQMATYFANDGWKDITISIPFNIHETKELNNIPPSCKINLVVDNPKTIELIEKNSTRSLGVYIEITTGYNRTGIQNYATLKIDELLMLISQYANLTFRGFLTHAGHTYQAASKSEIQNIHFDTLKKLGALKDHYIQKYPDLEISIGDTPSCSVSENFSKADEIRPGNFVFHDLMQHNIGACSIDDIALRMYCPVISKQQLSNEIVIYGGAIHFSKDYIRNTDGKELYGRIIINRGDKKELLDTTNYLCRLSQEHGIIKVNPKVFKQIEIGDILEIIPVHACLTAYTMGQYITNKGEKIEMMPRF